MRLRAPATKTTDHKPPIYRSRYDEKTSDLHVDEGDATAASELLREPTSNRAVGRRRSLYRFAAEQS